MPSKFILSPEPTSATLNDSTVVLDAQGGTGDMTPLVYPDDLLADNTNGPAAPKTVPFMAFYIFVPIGSKAVQDQQATLDETGTQLLTRNRTLNYADEVNNKFIEGNGKEVFGNLWRGNERIRIFRQVRALKKFICLYMPETLNSDLAANYSAGNLMGPKLQAAGAILDTVKMGIRGDAGIREAEETLTKLIAGLSEAAPIPAGIGQVAQFIQAGQGIAVNPLTEVFFENMNMRQFNFDFKFVPKTQDEMLNLQEIIRQFRLYMVPEIQKDSTAGLFFSTPGFFQIKYFIQKDGQLYENVNVPRISGCVLTNLTLDMAPDGFAMHTDGTPVAMRLNMTFQELEIMHRDRIHDFY